MEVHSEDNSQATASNPASGNQPSSEEMVKVIDRNGKIKEIPRSKYDRKKRSRKKRRDRRNFSYGSALSIAIILMIMIIAAYIALKIVQ